MCRSGCSSTRSTTIWQGSIAAGPPAMLASELGVAARADALRRIQLGPLTREQSDQLVDVAALNAAARERLFADTGGNPFYLKQLARAAPGSAAASGAANVLASDVPPEVAAALAAELGALSGRARAVVQAAAIAGEPFDPDLVRRIAGVAEGEVLAALDELLVERNYNRVAVGGDSWRERGRGSRAPLRQQSWLAITAATSRSSDEP